MSFGFAFAGKPADVKDAVANLDRGQGNVQLDAVKAFIASELDGWPTEGYANGVMVEASGHYDAWTRNVTVTIRPMKVAEPAQADAVDNATE